MKRSFQRFYWLLLAIGFCEAFCLLTKKQQCSLTSGKDLHNSFHDSDDHEANEDDDVDEDEFPYVDTSNFKVPHLLAYSLNGRSSPSQRKAIGLSRSSNATIHYCEHCGTEYVQWVGRCSTCGRWNTLKSQSVPRRSVDEISREVDRQSLLMYEEESSPVEFLFPDDSLDDVILMPEMKTTDKTRNDIVLVERPFAEHNRYNGIEGSAMTIWGMKPVTIKALVVEGNGIRDAEGISRAHLCRILAIIQKKFGIDFRQYDVYVECTSEVERSADLALVAAVISSLISVPVRTDSFLVGKIDILGHILAIDEHIDRATCHRIVGGMMRSKKDEHVDWISCRTISEALDNVLIGNLPSFINRMS